MKRLFSILSVVLITMSIAAQTIDYTNIQITEEKVHTKVVNKKYTFATFDYGFVGSLNRHNDNLDFIFGDGDPYVHAPGILSHAIGFSVGQVRQWGWYANIMFGTHMKIEEPAGGLASHLAKPHNSCFSIVPGVMCRCGIPLYAFIGVGYGYQADNILVGSDEESYWVLISDTRRLRYEDIENVESPKDLIHTVAWQVGFMGIIKCVAVKATVNGIGPCVGAELGIGYAFEHKN